MPPIQVNLPAKLLREAEARGLDLDKLLAAAVREEVRKQVREEERIAAVEAYIAEYEKNPPPPEVEAWADALFDRIDKHLSKNKRVS